MAHPSSRPTVDDARFRDGTATVFRCPALKQLAYAALFLVLAFALATVGITSSGREWLARELAFLEGLLETVIGTLLVAGVLVGAAILLVLVARSMVKPLLDGTPALVVNSHGLWHNTVPLGPYAYEWEEVERVRVEKGGRQLHTAWYVVLDLDERGSEGFDERRRGARINAGDVRGSLEDILSAMERHAPQVLVER